MGRRKTSVASIGAIGLAGVAAALALAAPATVADTPDRVEIRARADAQQRVDSDRVRVAVTVTSGEKVDVRVAGAVTGRGLEQSPLKPRTVALVPREPLLVRIGPKTRRGADAIAAHLDETGRAKARLRVTATDDRGNVETRSIQVRLKAERSK